MRLVLVGICLFFFVNTHAQLYDAQWVLGFDPSVVDFRNYTINLYKIPKQIGYFLTSACISDENGQLLYTCPGYYIKDKNGDTILNGSGLSPCQYSTDEAENGFAIPQGALFLPMPGSNRFYYLFHFSFDTLANTRPGTLYYSVIDKRGNMGLGEVVEKNVPILQRRVLRGGGMTACKHANGRDYWLVMPASDINRFYEYLITPDSVLGPFIQDIGPQFLGPDDNANSKFSPDGSKYATGIYDGPIIVMDFDRCSGTFSNAINIYHNVSYDPIHHPINGCSGLEFSPSGQFLYVTTSSDLTQYDLLSSNIQDSSVIYLRDSTDQYGIKMIELGPNGKLYGSTWNGGFYVLHVVHSPDLKGNNANFIYAGQPTLTANSVNVPNLINYKLGPLVGSGCDTISTGIGNETTDNRLIRIQPNPADKYLYVEMGRQGSYQFELINEAGQVIDKKETRQVDIFDTEHLPAGIYFVKATNRQNVNEVLTKKIVVVH